MKSIPLIWLSCDRFEEGLPFVGPTGAQPETTRAAQVGPQQQPLQHDKLALHC